MCPHIDNEYFHCHLSSEVCVLRPPLKSWDQKLPNKLPPLKESMILTSLPFPCYLGQVRGIKPAFFLTLFHLGSSKFQVKIFLLFCYCCSCVYFFAVFFCILVSFLFLFLETGSGYSSGWTWTHYMIQACLESSCFSLPNDKIIGMCHHAPS